MQRTFFLLALRATLVGASVCASSTVYAGLYYSGEKYASLPSQWRGFLLDHRLLRNLALKPRMESEASPLHVHYSKEAERLEGKANGNRLTADEVADLGALYVRLGEPGRAVEVLRKGSQTYANHFAIAANLGTAWQVLGDLSQAAAALELAVRLAPGKDLAAERAHLKLVRARQRTPAGELDDLFGVRFVGEQGAYVPGKLAASQTKKLPVHAVAVAQQLALWLPADGALLWQLGELANSQGDPRSAAAMLEGCVVQFGMNNPVLRRHRSILREASEEPTTPNLSGKEQHDPRHVGTLAFRSQRPLISGLLGVPLVAIDVNGINPVPWELFRETLVDKPFKARFPKYLQELQGRQVSLTGFIYPLREEPEMASFLFIEAPVGCWFCEMPDSTGILFVELGAGQTTRYQRGLMRIVGRLQLNTADPEDFLYSVKDARVGALD